MGTISLFPALRFHRRLPQFPIVFKSRDGSNNIWTYEVDSMPDGVVGLEIRARPLDEQYDGHSHYSVRLVTTDHDTIQVVSVVNGLGKHFQGRGLAPALYPDIAKRLRKRLVSSRNVVAPRAGSAHRLACVWDHLVRLGKATRSADTGLYEIDARLNPLGTDTPRPAPTNESEFQALMTDVDNHLQETGVPITARSLAGLGEVARLLRTELYPGFAGDPMPDLYEGIDLAIRVNRWFDARYADKQNIDFSPGTVVVLLKGDLWPMKLPWIAGRHVFFASATEKSDSGEGGPDIGPPRRFNVLDCFEDMSEDMRFALTAEELQGCLDVFYTARGAYTSIRDCRQLRYVQEADADHRATAAHLSGARPHAGQARWSALQAAEKMYKAYLHAMGADVPKGKKGHDLSFLNREAGKAGLEPADSFFVDAVNCSPDVRYGDQPSTLAEAVTAHQAALELTWYLGDEIRRVKGLPRRAF